MRHACGNIKSITDGLIDGSFISLEEHEDNLSVLPQSVTSDNDSDT